MDFQGEKKLREKRNEEILRTLPFLNCNEFSAPVVDVIYWEFLGKLFRRNSLLRVHDVILFIPTRLSMAKNRMKVTKKNFLYFSLQLNGWYLSNFLLTPRTQIFFNDFPFSISIMFENFILLRGGLYMKIMAILFFTLKKLHIRISTSICRWIRVRSSLIFQHNFSSLYLTYWFKHLVRLYNELAFIQLTRLCGD